MVNHLFVFEIELCSLYQSLFNHGQQTHYYLGRTRAVFAKNGQTSMSLGGRCKRTTPLDEPGQWTRKPTKLLRAWACKWKRMIITIINMTNSANLGGRIIWKGVFPDWLPTVQVAGNTSSWKSPDQCDRFRPVQTGCCKSMPLDFKHMWRARSVTVKSNQLLRATNWMQYGEDARNLWT